MTATRTCAEPDCVSAFYARGLCRRHYGIARRAGTLEQHGRERQPSGGPCRADGCQSPATDSGLCNAHRLRLQRHGTLGLDIDARRAAVTALLARVHEPEALLDGPCWEWPGPRNASGYGLVTGMASDVASRAIYQELFGPLPRNISVCHHCDNPPCVRPSHLFAGTQRDNALDAKSKGRLNSTPGESHPQARLTTADIAAIRRRASDGEALVSLARAYGVTAGYVSNIVARRVWRHVA